MTLSELRDRLECSPKPDAGDVRALTVLAIQLRQAGVVLTVEDCADRASLAAWVAASAWIDGGDSLTEAIVESDGGESVYMEAARMLAESLEQSE